MDGARADEMFYYREVEISDVLMCIWSNTKMCIHVLASFNQEQCSDRCVVLKEITLMFLFGFILSLKPVHTKEKSSA